MALLPREWSCLKQMPVTPIQNWLPCLIENDFPEETISHYVISKLPMTLSSLVVFFPFYSPLARFPYPSTKAQDYHH